MFMNERTTNQYPQNDTLGSFLLSYKGVVL